jgi:hypothetical protein
MAGLNRPKNYRLNVSKKHLTSAQPYNSINLSGYCVLILKTELMSTNNPDQEPQNSRESQQNAPVQTDNTNENENKATDADKVSSEKLADKYDSEAPEELRK